MKSKEELQTFLATFEKDRLFRVSVRMFEDLPCMKYKIKHPFLRKLLGYNEKWSKPDIIQFLLERLDILIWAELLDTLEVYDTNLSDARQRAYLEQFERARLWWFFDFFVVAEYSDGLTKDEQLEILTDDLYPDGEFPWNYLNFSKDQIIGFLVRNLEEYYTVNNPWGWYSMLRSRPDEEKREFLSRFEEEFLLEGIPKFCHRKTVDAPITSPDWAKSQIIDQLLETCNDIYQKELKRYLVQDFAEVSISHFTSKLSKQI